MNKYQTQLATGIQSIITAGRNISDGFKVFQTEIKSEIDLVADHAISTIKNKDNTEAMQEAVSKAFQTELPDILQRAFFGLWSDIPAEGYKDLKAQKEAYQAWLKTDKPVSVKYRQFAKDHCKKRCSVANKIWTMTDERIEGDGVGGTGNVFFTLKDSGTSSDSNTTEDPSRDSDEDPSQRTMRTQAKKLEKGNISKVNVMALVELYLPSLDDKARMKFVLQVAEFANIDNQVLIDTLLTKQQLADLENAENARQVEQAKKTGTNG